MSRSRNAACAGLMRSRASVDARTTRRGRPRGTPACGPDRGGHSHRERVRADRVGVEVALERPRLHDLARFLTHAAEVGELARGGLRCRSPPRTRAARTPARPRRRRARPSGSTTRRGPSWPRTARRGARAAPRARRPRGGRAGSRRCAWPPSLRIVTAMGLQEELIAALDAHRVVTGADELRRHGTDEGWHAPAAPDFVVYPRDTEEAAAVVRICATHEHADRARSAPGTSLEGHVAALEGGVSVDMTLMNAILRLSVEDMDVTVQAGVTRRQLDEKLRPEGVFFSRRPRRRRDARRDGRHRRLRDHQRPLRHDARERPQPHRRHRRRRDRAHALAGAQVERRLRPDAAVRRLRGHARADHRAHAARCSRRPRR